MHMTRALCRRSVILSLYRLRENVILRGFELPASCRGGRRPAPGMIEGGTVRRMCRWCARCGARGISGRLARSESLLRAPRGLFVGCDARRAEAVTAMVDGECTVEVRVDLDAGASVAVPRKVGVELEEPAVEWDGVVVPDGARVLEAADAVERWARRGRAPRGRGVRGGLGEASIVAREKTVEHALGLLERASLGQAQFHHEPILEGAKEAFDPALGLGRPGADPADAQFLQGAPHLRRCEPTGELLGKRRRRAGIAMKDAMAIGVDRRRKAVAPDELAQEQEVAVRIFLKPKHGGEHPTRRIVDGGEEHQAGPPVLEPGVVAAVHLDEEAGLRHALAPAAMARRPAAPWAGKARAAQEPLHRRAGEADPVMQSEQLGEMVVVHARVRRSGERENLGANSGGEPAVGGPATVPMGHGGGAVTTEAGQEAAEMPHGQAQERGRFSGPEDPTLEPGENVHAVLLLLVQGDRLPDHSPRVTESLSC